MYYFNNYYTDTIDEFKQLHSTWLDNMSKLMISNKAVETEYMANKQQLATINEVKNAAI